MFGLVREDKANPVDVGMEVSRNIIHSKRVNARKKLKNLWSSDCVGRIIRPQYLIQM